MQYNDDQQPLMPHPEEPHDAVMNSKMAQASTLAMQQALARLGLVPKHGSSSLQEGQLIDALDSADWQVRAAAIKTLGELKEGSSLGLLLRGAGDEHANVRVVAVRALAKRMQAECMPSLIAALRDPEWYVRAAAAQALGKMREHIPVAELLPALNDADESVRAAAVWALGQAGIDAPAEPLLGALNDPAGLVREAAEFALGDLDAQKSGMRPDDREEASTVISHSRTTDRSKAQRRFSWRRLMETGLVAAVLIILVTSWILIVQRPHLASPGSALSPTPVIYHGYSGAVYGGVYKVAWSPDGTLIASANADGSILVWNAVTGKTVYRYASPVSYVKILSMVWLPRNGLVMLSQHVDNTIDAWNPVTDSIYFSESLPTSISAGAWSPDGQHIAFDAGDHTIQVWNVFPVQKISTHSMETQEKISALAWSTDDKQLVSATYGGTIQIWNAATGKNAGSSLMHAGYVISLAWSPNGNSIAMGISDDTVQLWNKTTTAGNLQILRHTGGSITPFMALAWSPDSSDLAASDGAQVQVWDVTTRKQLMLYRGHTDHVNDVQWSPNGTKIASASLDNTAQVWLIV